MDVVNVLVNEFVFYISILFFVQYVYRGLAVRFRPRPRIVIIVFKCTTRASCETSAVGFSFHGNR